MMTRAGVERIMRFAFRMAQSRPRKLLTVITKSNAQRHAMVMWDEIAREIAQEFPDVKWDKELVDAATARMVNRPASLDTIVATNLHADILSDLAAALAGSLGIAPTGNIDPERRYPSMFEPIHGSAFDIMGKGLANPVGTFWSVRDAARASGGQRRTPALMEAIEQVTADPDCIRGDLGGKATTAAVTTRYAPPRGGTARRAALSAEHRHPREQRETSHAIHTCRRLALKACALAVLGLPLPACARPGVAEQAGRPGRALPAPGGTTDVLARALGRQARREHRPAGDRREQAGRGRTRWAPTTWPRPSRRLHAADRRGAPHDRGRVYKKLRLRLPEGLRADDDRRAGSQRARGQRRTPDRRRRAGGPGKSQPNKFSFGSNGNGTAQHLSARSSRTAPAPLIHVPYKGSGPSPPICSAARSDVVRHRHAGVQHIKCGKLRALAVTTASAPRPFPTCRRWTSRASRASTRDLVRRPGAGRHAQEESDLVA